MTEQIKPLLIIIFLAFSILALFGGKIHQAAFKGDMDAIKKMTAKNSEIIHKADKEYGGTPFIWAAAGQKKDVMDYLVKLGADINAQEPGKSTALHIVSQNGHTDIAQYLVSLPGCKIDPENDEGDTPLLNAASNGHKDLCRFLVSKHARLTQVNKNKRSVAFYAAASGDTQLTEMAIKNGVDINIKDVYNATAIQAAVFHGHTETVKRLAALGADTAVKDNNGGSLLHIASQRGHINTVQALLDLKLDKNAADKYNHSPIHYARSCNHPAIAALLDPKSEKNTKPASTPTADPKRQPLAEQITAPVTITILVDNYLFGKGDGLKTDWGFSCLVEGTDEVILFDTGNKPEILQQNVKTLGVDLTKVQRIVISHNHYDHISGLESVLKIKTGIPVHLTYSSHYGLVSKYSKAGASVVTVAEPMRLHRGVWLYGEMGEDIKEHGMVMDTPKGLVIINGCSHPGIVQMVARAKKLMNKNVYLVLGGFHLGGKSKTELNQVIADLKELGVQKVGATHCTGKKAIQMFKDIYKENFVDLGIGRVLVVK